MACGNKLDEGLQTSEFARTDSDAYGARNTRVQGGVEMKLRAVRSYFATGVRKGDADRKQCLLNSLKRTQRLEPLQVIVLD